MLLHIVARGRIGRGPEADFRIEHPSISRLHCSIRTPAGVRWMRLPSCSKASVRSEAAATSTGAAFGAGGDEVGGELAETRQGLVPRGAGEDREALRVTEYHLSIRLLFND